MDALLGEIDKGLVLARAEQTRLKSGTKSAAPRLRAALMDISRLTFEGRKLALESAKAIPAKPRAGAKKAVAAAADDESLPLVAPELMRQDGMPAAVLIPASGHSAPNGAAAKKRGRPKKASPAAVEVSA